MLRVIDAKSLGSYRLRLVFSDGISGVVDLTGRLNGPVFEPLRDEQFFDNFQLTDHTLQWPNGADFAPEYLRGLVGEAAVEREDLAAH